MRMVKVAVSPGAVLLALASAVMVGLPPAGEAVESVLALMVTSCRMGVPSVGAVPPEATVGVPSVTVRVSWPSLAPSTRM